MELIERSGFLVSLQQRFAGVSGGEGHCVFISGEAGIGKTSLVKAFCREQRPEVLVYEGACDALFAPRPLAPLYDMATQLRSDFWTMAGDMNDRAKLFIHFLKELSGQPKPCIVVFEDIHWADEATLDFIKFLSRRITRLRCLFLLTYRDDEINLRHPLRNMLGQLPADSFTRMPLAPLSRAVVEKLAADKGYNGEDVYSISGGNPFYVNEILASYSPGVPDNVRDSILSVYNRQDVRTKEAWGTLSIFPTGLEISYLHKISPEQADMLDECLASNVLVQREGKIVFKHELYRRTIESALSPLVRVKLNKMILELFVDSFERNGQTERIIHHAKNANAYDLIEHYAPHAAREAAAVGAHIEASRLYYTAIEYYQGTDKNVLIGLYEAYAYECYLTNLIREAIIYRGKLLTLFREMKDEERTGDCLRWLSRLWWFEGNRRNAEGFGKQAIDVLRTAPASAAKAMAFSNMSQLKMLSGEPDDCIFWGEQAIDMARALGNDEILSHALNNVGAVKMDLPAMQDEGIDLLQQSLALALKGSYHEHAARAYTNLSSSCMKVKEYVLGGQMLEEGIAYCEERDLNSWTAYMGSWKARFLLETGKWEAADRLAMQLLGQENQPAVVKITALVIVALVQLRKGKPDALSLLASAKELALGAQELQRLGPVVVAYLEYEWITAERLLTQETLDAVKEMAKQTGTVYENNEFDLWLSKARGEQWNLNETIALYDVRTVTAAAQAAELWEQRGCPYEQAICLLEGSDTDKRKALTIFHGLGASAVCGKLKEELQAQGVKGVPRGMRKSTQANPALLTDREMGVLLLLKEGLQNKEIAAKLFISAKTVDHHISSILFKLDAKTRVRAVQEALRLKILK